MKKRYQRIARLFQIDGEGPKFNYVYNFWKKLEVMRTDTE